jgi:Tol biopolymer transport system component
VDPIWSPDGRTLYFTSRRRGSYDIFRKASDGASPEQLVLSDAATKAARSVSPDGKLLLYSKWDEKAKSQLWVLPLTANAGENPPPRVFRQTPFSQAHGQFSPDGHWVAYDSDESGRTEVYVAPFPGPGGARQISAAGGFDPRWRRDGKELFYVAPDSLMAAAVSIRNGTLEVGGVQKLMAAPQGGIYDVTADGQKFLRVESNGGTSALPLTLRENWPASLRK